jgi:DNA primase
MKRFTSRIVLAYDADEAGQTAAERVYEWEQRHEIEVSVLGLPPGTDPDELARSDPAALQAAVAEARPLLGFRIDRVLKAANLASPEGRSRAATAAIDAIREHPDPLVRDQYLMDVAGPTRIREDQLRAQLARPAVPRTDGPPERGVPAAARPAVRLRESIELEAIRLLLERPADIADRLHPVLFREGLTRRTYEEAASGPLHDVIETAEPAVADLLTRLAVEESTSQPTEVLVGLAMGATARAIDVLQSEQRASDDPMSFMPTLNALKLMSDDLHGDEPSMDSLDRLLAWLGEHAEEIGC